MLQEKTIKQKKLDFNNLKDAVRKIFPELSEVELEKIVERNICTNVFSEKKDIELYQIAFEKYFLKSLTSRLSDYSSSEFEVIEADKKSTNYTIIKSKITPKNGNPEIKIDWRIYTKNPDKPLIRDLIVEGLSLARTQKEEFSSILNSNDNDLSVLISKLEEFVKN